MLSVSDSSMQWLLVRNFGIVCRGRAFQVQDCFQTLISSVVCRRVAKQCYPDSSSHLADAWQEGLAPTLLLLPPSAGRREDSSAAVACDDSSLTLVSPL